MQGRFLVIVRSLVSLCFMMVYIPFANAATIDKLIVFGDSLSDTGNIHAITATAHQAIPLVPVIPNDKVYYHGRFSNGPIWVDRLAKQLNVDVDNYAYGGAWIEPLSVSKLSMPINLSLQVDFFLVKAMMDTHTRDHLYVIWAGGNDYVKGRDDADTATSTSVKLLKDQIEWLRYYGARYFLIPNLPDISVAPQVINEGTDAIAAAKRITLMHNAKLDAMLKDQRRQHPGDTFVLLDLTDDMDDIVAHPDKYQLKNVTEACYGGGYWYKLSALASSQEIQAAKNARIDLEENTSIHEAYLVSKLAESGVQPCANPDSYLFWDHLHPTRVAHQIISTLAQIELGQHDIQGK